MSSSHCAASATSTAGSSSTSPARRCRSPRRARPFASFRSGTTCFSPSRIARRLHVRSFDRLAAVQRRAAAAPGGPPAQLQPGHGRTDAHSRPGLPGRCELRQSRAGVVGRLAHSERRPDGGRLQQSAPQRWRRSRRTRRLLRPRRLRQRSGGRLHRESRCVREQHRPLVRSHAPGLRATAWRRHATAQAVGLRKLSAQFRRRDRGTRGQYVPDEPARLRARFEHGHGAGQGPVLGHAVGQRRRAGLRFVPLHCGRRRPRSQFDQPQPPGRRHATGDLPQPPPRHR